MCAAGDLQIRLALAPFLSERSVDLAATIMLEGEPAAAAWRTLLDSAAGNLPSPADGAGAAIGEIGSALPSANLAWMRANGFSAVPHFIWRESGRWRQAGGVQPPEAFSGADIRAGDDLAMSAPAAILDVLPRVSESEKGDKRRAKIIIFRVIRFPMCSKTPDSEFSRGMSKGTLGRMRGNPNGRLTDALVHEATRPGKLYDGVHGLYLRIDPSGARRWMQRIAVSGRRREFGLGGYPLGTLAEAREKALANRRIARQGGDPSESPWQARPAVPAPASSAAPTFSEAAVRFIALQTPGWKNGGTSAFQWQSSLDQYASPVLDSMRIDEIESAHAATAVLPIWETKRETASRIRQRIGAIME